MNKTILFNFLVDKENRQIRVEREFDAETELVWSAWTKSEILDQWWAPHPWKAETKSMNFTQGGRWLYAMVSPEGEKHWALFDYKTIVPGKSISGSDAFCDENGIINDLTPVMHWDNNFTENKNKTLVNIVISFDKPSDLESIIQMGFKEGFTKGLENLDEWLSQNTK